MKPFLSLRYAPAPSPMSSTIAGGSAAATLAPSALMAKRQTLLIQARTSFASARTSYKSLLHSQPSSSTSASDYHCSAALGSLGCDQAWRKEIQANMRACIAAELVLRRIESAGADGGNGGKAALRWRVEGLEERETKGVGRWIVPVVVNI